MEARRGSLVKMSVPMTVSLKSVRNIKRTPKGRGLLKFTVPSPPVTTIPQDHPPIISGENLESKGGQGNDQLKLPQPPLSSGGSVTVPPGNNGGSREGESGDPGTFKALKHSH